MESLFLLEKLLEKDDYLFKLDLMYTYFSVPLSADSQKYENIFSKEISRERPTVLISVCFGVFCSKIFYEAHKVPMSLLKRLNI